MVLTLNSVSDAGLFVVFPLSGCGYGSDSLGATDGHEKSIYYWHVFEKNDA